MKNFDDLLKGGDLRTIGRANEVVKAVNDQNDFDTLFRGLFHQDRKVVMRTADAIEKITLAKPAFLSNHKKEILELCTVAKHIELKWHLALMASRLTLTAAERETIWQRLTEWARDKKESRIVRVNSVQGLFDLLRQDQTLKQDFDQTINRIARENIPSLNARIRMIRNSSSYRALA
jgi:hypothetical protein